MAEPLVHINSSPSLEPEQVAGRSFALVRRGFDPDAVRKYLEEVAALLRDARSRENSLRVLLEEAQRQVETPHIDNATLSAAVGAETGRVLQVAHEAAHEVVEKAEAKAASLISSAETKAQDRLQIAQREATNALTRARAEADAALEASKRTCLEMVEEAREARRRILGDLAERRRSLHSQLEQLRAGKNTLATVVDAVSSSVEAIRDRLVGAEEEARDAADVAARFPSSFDDGVSLDELVANALAHLPSTAESPSNEVSTDEVPTESSAGELSGGELAVGELSIQVSQIDAESRSSLSTALFDGRALEDSDEQADFDGHELDGDNASLVEMADHETDDATVAGAPVDDSVNSEGIDTTDAADVDLEVAASDQGESDEAANSVDELFAKIRASRASELDHARSVLERLDETEATELAATDADVTEPQVSVDVDVDVEAVGATPAIEAEETPQQQTDTDESPSVVEIDATEIEAGDEVEPDRAVIDIDPAFALRDEFLAAELQQVSRSLKRALASEQNELLDAVRHLAKGVDVATLFDDEATRERLALACASGLSDSFRAGARFGEKLSDDNGAKSAGNGGISKVIEKEAAVAGDEIGRSLAGEVSTSVSRRIADGLSEAGTDQGALATLIGVAYREWKGARVESVAGDFATRAFALGTRASASKRGLKVSWVLDSSGTQCGDCDDNALAGGQTSGDPFPTGQTDPPAHPGCRCLLVPIVS